MAQIENFTGEPNDDAVLVSRIAAKDQAALQVVYDRYANLVYSVACRVVHNESSAEEILQDVFYQLWRHADRFDATRGALPCWLTVVARNRGISWLRRQRGFAEVADPAEEPAILPRRLDEPVERQTLVAELRARLEKLPEAQRVVAELAYFNGMSHSEIAKQTGKSLGTVKTLLRAAVGSLRQAFGEDSEPETQGR